MWEDLWYLARSLEEVGVSKGGTQAEDKVAFRVLGDGLHDGTVHDDQMFGGCFDATPFSRLAGVEEQRGPFEADPVALPAAFTGQLDLVLFAQQPLLHAQKSAIRRVTMDLDQRKN